MKDNHAVVLAFLKSQPMATISTVRPRAVQPESALIAFAETEKLEIIFETFVNTRKWYNLRRNPHVALVIGWDTKHHLTVQYEGKATLIPKTEIDSYRQIFLAKDTPCTATFLHDPRVRLFKVRPLWIRYADYTDEVPCVIEMSFDF